MKDVGGVEEREQPHKGEVRVRNIVCGFLVKAQSIYKYLRPDCVE